MRISGHVNPLETVSQSNTVQATSKSNATTESVEQLNTEVQASQGEEQVISKEKLKQAVDSVNEFLQANHSASKFVFHEGLDRYFVQVVDTKTEEVVKEIPPKKLLDAFYEMQKLLGMIVDEKI